MEMIIKNNFIIDDIEIVQELLEKLSEDKIELEKMEDFIVNQPHTIFYFNQDLSEKDANDNDVKMVWIDTGYCCNLKPIFISLLKCGNEFVGHFVGTAHFLVNGLINRYGKENLYKTHLTNFMKKYKEKFLLKRTIANLMVEHGTSSKVSTEHSDYFNNNEIEKQLIGIGYKINHDVKWMETESQEGKEIPKQMSCVTQDIYKNLLYPNWKSIEGLDRYIKVIGCRIKQLVEQGKKEYFVINNIRSVVINTGLLDMFGADYYLLYKYHEKYKTYIVDMIISSKTDYINNGFSKEDANRAGHLKPIQFLDEPMCLEATMDDFDINQKCLMHIIEERKDRFPESIQGEPVNCIFTKIKESLERGLKIQMRDHSYAKLTYSGRDGKISWMLPLHIKYDFTKEPELVMLIRKKDEYYEVKTILPYDDDLKDRIIAMHLYNALW